jgi:AraC family transcriptional regulator of adaptative response/methylated-DNA-[protein]-cysteine methyltransferase
MSWLNLDRLK